MAAFEHNLTIDISRKTSTKALRIKDTSFYSRDVENMLLEILAPTASVWRTFKVIPRFDFIANSVSLGLANHHSSGEIPDLPDGVYQIKVSVKPNFATHQEFYHLRINALTLEWEKELCKLYSEQCSLTKKEFEESKRKLLDIHFDLLAAVSKVEICHKRKEGLNLYTKAKDDLKKYRNECGC